MVPATESAESSQHFVLAEELAAQRRQLGLAVGVKLARVGAQFDAFMLSIGDLA